MKRSSVAAGYVEDDDSEDAYRPRAETKWSRGPEEGIRTSERWARAAKEAHEGRRRWMR